MIKSFDEGFAYKDGYERPFQCIYLTIKENFPASIFHYHDYIEMLYGIKCDMDVWVNDKTFHFESGDLILINPHDSHYLKNNIKESKYIVIKFTKSLLQYGGQTPPEAKYMYPFLNSICRYDNIIKKGSVDDKRIKEMVLNIYKEFEKEEFGYELIVRSGILNIYTQILRHWSKTDTGEKIFAVEDNVSATMYKAAEYIIDNFARITEEEVADKFSMSYSYFSRKFKAVIGKTFSEYLTSVRIDVAKKMLLTTDKSITDIAVDIGFSSSSHFIYAFRTKVGCSPLAYKKKFKNNIE